mmetsp:Transcript_17768/g.23005  ORF Transcript_17768/g.23005 Transcript_17768/m.23005 type:complete len:263 (+) Transcript_17768:81-869(+)
MTMFSSRLRSRNNRFSVKDTISEDKSHRNLGLGTQETTYDEDEDETDSVKSDSCSSRGLFRSPKSITQFIGRSSWGGTGDLSLASSLIYPWGQKEGKLREMERHVEKLSRGIRDCIMCQTNHEEELNKAVQVHVDRAKARLAANNKFGAALSMRKVKTNQAERARVVAALDYLQRQETNLLIRLSEAKAVSALKACGEEEGFSTAADDSTIFDTSSFRHYEEQVKEILSFCQEDKKNSDDELLSDIDTFISSNRRGDRYMEI